MQATSEYYGRKCVEWINSNDIQTYYELVEDAIKIEESRVKTYLNPSTLPKTLTITLSELMIKPKQRVKDSFDTILRTCADNMKVLYVLCQSTCDDCVDSRYSSSVDLCSAR